MKVQRQSNKNGKTFDWKRFLDLAKMAQPITCLLAELEFGLNLQSFANKDPRDQNI